MTDTTNRGNKFQLYGDSNKKLESNFKYPAKINFK